VSRTGLMLGSRLALALLGVLVAGIETRSVCAMGCHVGEKPILALSRSWESTPRVIEPAHREPSMPSFVPVPCTDDVPGVPGSVAPRQCPEMAIPWAPAPECAGPLVARAESSFRPRLVASWLDRPPRPLPAQG
jgi:hypothetical protein